MHEPPLQNLTAIGTLNDDVRQPGLAVQAQHSVYVSPTELTDKKQAAVHNNSAFLNPYISLGTCIHTNVPPSEVQDIDVPTAAAMCKVHIRQFCASTHKWNRWRYDFEVAMKGAEIPQARSVAVLPSHLDDLSRDVYEEITTPG